MRKTRNQHKRELQRTVCMVAALFLLFMMLCTVLVKAWLDEEPLSGREYLSSIQVESVNYGSSKTAIACQASTVPEVTEDVTAISFYPVILDHDTQAFIIRSCERLNMDSAVIIAIIDQESDFNPECVGDNGDSVGLMQVQQQWHHERMDRLDVTDLMNPLQNVAVGMDYLAELLDEGNGLEWALAAYNAGATGANNGIGFDYAASVIEISENLKGSVFNG